MWFVGYRYMSDTVLCTWLPHWHFNFELKVMMMQRKESIYPNIWRKTIWSLENHWSYVSKQLQTGNISIYCSHFILRVTLFLLINVHWLQGSFLLSIVNEQMHTQIQTHIIAITHMSTQTHVHTHACLHADMHAYTHAHTHIHTNTNKPLWTKLWTFKTG